MDLMNVLTKLEFRSFTRSWDNCDWSFGWGLWTPILGKRRPQGSRWYVPFKRAVVSSYKPLNNVSSITTRFKDIAAFVLQHATFFHPPLLSPKFPHVPLEVGTAWILNSQERRSWANWTCNYFPTFPTYVILIHQRYRQTNGRTGGRTTCNPNTALCTIVHRAVKKIGGLLFI